MVNPGWQGAGTLNVLTLYASSAMVSFGAYLLLLLQYEPLSESYICIYM